MAAAISNEKELLFTHIQLGDGVYNGSYLSKKSLENEVMQIPVTRVSRRENEVTVECDWNTAQAPNGFYFREIGIIGNGVLCYYDNAGTGDAEYIDPESEVVSKEKRIRLTIVISADLNVTVYTASNLYALKKELDEVNNDKISKNDISEWAMQPNKPSYTKTEVGLGNVDNTSDKDKPVSTPQQQALNQHDSSSDSHDDIRNLISNLTTRLNALADSDDTTLDQLSEIVAYIKNNKSLIDNVTTSKINVSDIINGLTSTAANKPLSAKQGKVLNDLITELTDDVRNKADESSLDAKVNKSGDKMTGELVMEQGSMVARETGTSGVYGYVKMVQLKILRQYIDYPIIFEIAGRGWTSSNKLYVKFESDSGSDPQLNSFLIDKTAPYKVAMVKSGTSTWDIYMQKSQSYGSCIVCSMSNTNYADAVQITFPDTLVSTLPSEAIEPTVITWDKAKNADTVDGKHFSDIQELINNKQNIRNGNVGENVDWNTIVTPGAHKIQYTTMDADHHAPVGEYRFGILFVIDSEIGGESRILQMYFPHQPNISPLHIRMRNDGVWKDWVAVTSAIGETGNAATLGGMNKDQFVHKASPVFDGNLNCRGNIWFNGEVASKLMIQFLESGNTDGHGISIGGGGMTIIGGGESAYTIAQYYTNDGTAKNGGTEKMIVGNDGIIEFLTNCQNGFSSAKHITMNEDGTITAEGFDGNSTSASCILDDGDKRKTYMKYSANCVDDFTYLAVWKPISGGIELRAFNKANLKDKLGFSTATASSNGLMSVADKKKLDGVAANANNYTHPDTTGYRHIPSGGTSGQILRCIADGAAVWSDAISVQYGNWTPTLYLEYGNSSAPKFTGGGYYRRFGSFVYIEGSVTNPSNNSSSSGGAIGGFPFPLKRVNDLNNIAWIFYVLSSDDAQNVHVFRTGEQTASALYLPVSSNVSITFYGWYRCE